MSHDRKIPLGSKLAFGVGQTAEGIKDTTYGLFVFFYYSQVLGLAPQWVSLALFLALIFDSFADPVMGSISDGWRSRLGRRHPFMYASALPLALGFCGLFAPPAGLSQPALFAWLLGLGVLTRAGMTLFHVPHLALGAELSENFEERTSVVAYRQSFACVGALLVAVLGFGFYFSDARGGRMAEAAYAPFGFVLAIVMAASILLSTQGTRREIPHLIGPGPVAPQRWQVFADLVSAFANASFRWLFGGVLVVFVMVGVGRALNLHMYEFFWELSGTAMLAVNLASPAGVIAGSLFTRGLHRRFGKRAGLLFGTAGWALCQFAPVVLRVIGLFPANGDALLVGSLAGFSFVQGVIVQQALVSFGSMMADVADEHELESGRRQEGIFFGAISFSTKLASGGGGMFAGLGLAWIAWPATARVAADVAPDTLLRLGLLYGPGVAACAALSLFCFAYYRLTRERHAQILQELHERRAAAPAPGDLAVLRPAATAELHSALGGAPLEPSPAGSPGAGA
jgi:GPH family glycoside/pentoside/hexuronide:cation symporter